MPKHSVKKNRQLFRKKTLRKQRLNHKGGAPVLPSEYFGRDSGRYSVSNGVVNPNAVSYGEPNNSGSLGPNLAPYPENFNQNGSGMLQNIRNFWGNKKEEDEDVLPQTEAETVPLETAETVPLETAETAETVADAPAKPDVSAEIEELQRQIDENDKLIQKSVAQKGGRRKYKRKSRRSLKKTSSKRKNRKNRKNMKGSSRSLKHKSRSQRNRKNKSHSRSKRSLRLKRNRRNRRK